MKNHKECIYCGRDYFAIRNSALYCSDSCKTMACRARKKADLEAANEMARVKKFKQMESELMERMYEYLEKLKADFESKK